MNKPLLRTIIAGSRNATQYACLVHTMSSLPWRPSVILSGTARGADRLGERWAQEHGVQVEYYPADWDAFGKSAGYKRNAEMATKADALVALWDYKSRGTKHMIDLAARHGLRIQVVNFELWEALYG